MLHSAARGFPAAVQQPPLAGAPSKETTSAAVDRAGRWSLGPRRTRCPWAHAGTLPGQAEVHVFPFLSKRTGLSAQGRRLGASQKPELSSTCSSRRGGVDCQQAALEAGLANSSENPFLKHQNLPKSESPLLPLPCGLPSCQCLQATWPSPCQALITSLLPPPNPPNTHTLKLHLLPDLRRPRLAYPGCCEEMKLFWRLQWGSGLREVSHPSFSHEPTLSVNVYFPSQEQTNFLAYLQFCKVLHTDQ